MVDTEIYLFWNIFSGMIEFWKQLSKILLPRAGTWHGKLHPEWFKTWQWF